METAKREGKMKEHEIRIARIERDMHTLLAKMAVWEVAISTLLEILAKSSPAPKQAVDVYRDAVKRRIAQISHDRWPDDKAWIKAINLCHENFEQLLKFTFDADLPEKPLN
jgi:hypothetical protein